MRGAQDSRTNKTADRRRIHSLVSHDYYTTTADLQIANHEPNDEDGHSIEQIQQP